MERIKEILRAAGVQYKETAADLLHHFQKALRGKNQIVINSLLFPGSPIASIVNPRTQKTALHCVSEYRSSSSLLTQSLIDLGANVNAQNINDETPLHCALHLRMKETVDVLIKNGADVNVRCKTGTTPIQDAMLLGSLETVEMFLRAGKLPNIQEDNTKRCLHLIQILLNERQHCIIPKSNYSALLQFALLQKDEECFDFVLMNSDFDLSAVDPKGETLLHVAAQQGTPIMINALINRGAKIEAVSTFASHILFTSRHKRARLNSRDQGERTALHFAVLNNNPENVKCLLDAGACVNRLTKEKNTPLHYAAAVENFEIVEMLVKRGADVNAISYYGSPLLVACGSIGGVKRYQRQYFEFNSIYYKKCFHKKGVAPSYIYSSKIVTFLLDHGADIEESSSVGRTALAESCCNGNVEIAKILLSRDAIPNRNGYDLLHDAVFKQDLDIIRLISKHVNVNKSSCGIPLHWVASNPSITSEDIVDILVEHGANINRKDDRTGESPLHLAGLNKNKAAILRRLLKFNANINSLDELNRTALQIVHRPHSNITPDAFEKDEFKNAKILVAAVAKKIELKQWVSSLNVTLVKSDEYFHVIYNECQREIQRMKETKISASANFVFYDILVKGIDKLGALLKNEDIIQVLETGEYKQEFPHYADDMSDRIEDATGRRKLLESCVVLFTKYVSEHVHHEVLFRVFKLLKLKDLQNFTEACFTKV